MIAAKRVLFALAMIALVARFGGAAPQEGRILRFPDIKGDRVAFVHGGDIWTASTVDGVARRLTSSKGQELFPRFSPDGKWIAFTGEYDGNRDVYVMPSEGGEPRRLTYSPDQSADIADRMGPDNLVMGWTPDGKSILYRSRGKKWDILVGGLYTVPLEGGLPQELPLPRGGFTSFSPDGKKIAFNRIFREFRTWKHYRGGQADDIWTYDLQTGAIENLTTNVAQDIIPIWRGNKVYFVSDRDHTANLFVCDLGTKQTRKLTSFTEFDVKFPNADASMVVFENGGYLYALDMATEQSKKLTIYVNDDQPFARASWVPVNEKITEFDVAPDASRAVFVARGEIFTVPGEKGNTRNVTESSGVREKNAYWSPDGKWIAYISDATGEDEIYIRAQDGRGEPQRITSDGKAFRFQAVWSKDSKKLLAADKNLRLYYVDVATKQTTEIDRAVHGEITMYSWSPDSKWVAYVKPEQNRLARIFLYSLDQKKIFPVTDELSNSYAPVFDPEGKYLYFLSDRDFKPTFGPFELNWTYLNMTRPYAVTLQANEASPFAPQSDEVKIGEEKKKAEEEKKKEGEAKKGAKEEEKKEPIRPIKVDTERIDERVVGFPVEPDNFTNLSATKQKVFYIVRPIAGKAMLKMYDMEKRKESELFQADSFVLAENGEKLIYQSEKTYGIVDAKPGAKTGDGALNLTGLKIKLDPKLEWAQIFNEVWRLERDYFYSANMHGVDWPKMKERFGQLLPYVSHRSDLTYILGEMIGELDCSHSYVGGGDVPAVDKVSVGLLGADIELDAAAGRYRIRRILEGQNWIEGRRSPLTEPGINAKAGDYILAIDGKDLKAPATPFGMLENTVGRTVTLKLGTKPDGTGAREVTVKPIASEAGLNYYNWVEHNRMYVQKATNGEVAYVHIPDMGEEGLDEFVKYFYPQIKKKGLIVDVRYNGGGFVSQTIIERLRRVLTGMDAPRGWTPGTYPDAVFVGPKVCLINELSMSDGDIFPYMFRKTGLGPLIGKRTWGGVVGIRGGTPLIDGGYVTQPEFGTYSAEGTWVIENEGVSPDIEVDNLPWDEYHGKDAQLDRAIEEVTKAMKEHPQQPPPRPADPVRK